MKFEYDPEADASYIQIAEGVVHETIEITDGLHVDLDEEGHPLGIEILSVIARGAKIKGWKKMSVALEGLE